MFEYADTGAEWREIPSCPGYMACSDGRIKSKRKELKPRANQKGYYRVRITLVTGSGGALKSVARLVCEAFKGDPKNGEECDHINSDRSDNRSENLRWLDQGDNKRRSSTARIDFFISPSGDLKICYNRRVFSEINGLHPVTNKLGSVASGDRYHAFGWRSALNINAVLASEKRLVRNSKHWSGRFV